MARLSARFALALRQSAVARWTIAHLGAAYIRLVARLVRWEILGLEHKADVVARGTGIIASIWHGRLFMSATYPVKGRRTLAMISNNRDGDLISAVVARFDVVSVRGSTYDRVKGRDKGGAEVYATVLEELRDNHAVIAITPDGPRGPRMRAQKGAAGLSIASGCPVLPIAFSVERGRVLRSWDRFLVPWPRGRGVIIYGAPLDPPAEADDTAIEAFRLRIEAATTEITNRADDLCGRPAIAPDPL